MALGPEFVIANPAGGYEIAGEMFLDYPLLFFLTVSPSWSGTWADGKRVTLFERRH